MVREKFVEGEKYRAALFGAFTSKKFALALKKKVLAEVPCIFTNVEIVGLNIGQRHEYGTAMTAGEEHGVGDASDN